MFLLSSVLTRSRRVRPAPARDIVEVVNGRAVFKARDSIAARVEERLRLEELAAASGISPFHLQRVFAKTFGETPHEFATRLKMDRAKRMLLMGNHSVTEVCFEVGYESLGTFSSRFRKKTGMSPSEFQREARRVFAGADNRWAGYYVPACFQHFLL